jgi:hypothetical protein
MLRPTMDTLLGDADYSLKEFVEESRLLSLGLHGQDYNPGSQMRRQMNKNPLVDIHNTLSIRYVIKNGELYDGDTLDTMYPVAKKLDKQYWWDGEPSPRISVQQQ